MLYSPLHFYVAVLATLVCYFHLHRNIGCGRGARHKLSVYSVCVTCWIWLSNISEHSVWLEQPVEAHVGAGLLVLTVYNVKLMYAG